MAGPTYNASSTYVVTALHSLASSQDWLIGWFSASIDNTTNAYLDYMISGTFTTHASNRQAGYINIYAVLAINDTPTWPASDTGTPGTQGAGSFVDTEERDANTILLDSIYVDGSASAIVTMQPISLVEKCGLIMPPTHFGLYISQNATTTTTAGLASAGSAVYSTAIVSP